MHTWPTSATELSKKVARNLLPEHAVQHPMHSRRQRKPRHKLPRTLRESPLKPFLYVSRSVSQRRSNAFARRRRSASVLRRSVASARHPAEGGPSSLPALCSVINPPEQREVVIWAAVSALFLEQIEALVWKVHSMVEEVASEAVTAIAWALLVERTAEPMVRVDGPEESPVPATSARQEDSLLLEEATVMEVARAASVPVVEDFKEVVVTGIAGSLLVPTLVALGARGRG